MVHTMADMEEKIDNIAAGVAAIREAQIKVQASQVFFADEIKEIKGALWDEGHGYLRRLADVEHLQGVQVATCERVQRETAYANAHRPFSWRDSFGRIFEKTASNLVTLFVLWVFYMAIAHTEVARLVSALASQ